MRMLLLAVTILVTAHAATAQSPASLFVHRAAAAAVASGSDSAGNAIVSSARVGLRLDALFEASTGVARQIVLNVGDHTWTARFERLDADGAGFRSWVGSLDGVADSHVVFTERGGVVSGLINAVGTTYQIRTIQPGSYVLERVDISRLRDERDPVDGMRESAISSDGPAVATDAASTIDVLMLYTPAARLQRGGPAQMEALISQIISDTNTAFARSGITPRVRLVAARELAFVEAPLMSIDLPALRASAEARALRDLARADLVQLLVSSPDQSSCGVGYLLSSLAATNFDAYSIADVACAAQYTPTHEMGHNMGSHHAPEDGASSALMPYSYGFKDPARGFRTVMAYGCVGVPCGRIPNFSNPTVGYNGGATGTGAQNNARSINEAAQTVANFRQSTVPALTPPRAPTGLQSIVDGNTVTVAWHPVLAEFAQQPSASTSYFLQAGTAPGASNVFNASVGATTTVSGVVPGGAYFWRVFAVNAAGASPQSAESQFVIPECVAPSPPGEFRHSLNARTVTLMWAAPAHGSAPMSYVVEAGSAPALANLLIAPVGAVTSGSTPAPPGTYYVRVRAQNACGTSAPSNEQVIVVP